MGNSHIKLSDWIFEGTPEAGILIPDAVIAYWKMDEDGGDIVDSLGTHTLSEVGTVAVGTDGIFGNYRMQFAAGSYFSDLAASANPVWGNDGSRTFVFEAFVKATAFPGTAQAIYAVPWKNTYSTVTANLDIRSSNRTVRATDGYRSVTSLEISPNVWYHIMHAKVAGSIEDGSQLLLINGEVVATSGAESTEEEPTHTEFRIGMSNTFSYPASDLQICDAAYWSTLSLLSVPGEGSLTERLTAIAAARYNDGAGQQYIIS